jgi:hypothetical protein
MHDGFNLPRWLLRAAAICLNILLARTHKKSKTADMGKEPVKLSPGNINAVWKRLSKGTNAPYEKKCTSLLALRGAVDAAHRSASSILFHN